MEATVKYRSVNNCGINIGTGEENLWVNFDSQGNAHAVETMKQRMQGLRNGSVIELEMGDDKHFTDYKVMKEPEKKEGSWDDREVVGLKELLSAAHRMGLQSIQTEVVKIDYDKRMAHVKAYVLMADGKNFHGSACKSADKMQGKQGDYYLETIESQAIARALRWATNTGDVSDVEVGTDAEERHDENKDDGAD